MSYLRTSAEIFKFSMYHWTPFRVSHIRLGQIFFSSDKHWCIREHNDKAFTISYLKSRFPIAWYTRTPSKSIYQICYVAEYRKKSENKIINSFIWDADFLNKCTIHCAPCMFNECISRLLVAVLNYYSLIRCCPPGIVWGGIYLLRWLW